MNDTVDVRLDRLVYGGDAIGRLPDGRAVFVPFTLPGELVRVRLVEEKPRYTRAELLEVLEPSPGRVTPRCLHYAYCGGCHYQHMSYTDQLEAKSAIVQEQLERIGGMKHLPTVDLLEAPQSWYYRNHIQFHLTRDGKLGFQKSHSNQTFSIRECHLPEAAISQLWPKIEIEPIPGLERISVRCGKDDDLIIVLESTDPQALEFSVEDLTVSMLHQGPGGSFVMAGSDHILMEISGKDFWVSGASFFQVNTRQAEAMVSYIMENLPADGTMSILDLYCGVGLFSAFLAPKVKSLVGVEISPEACADFTINLDDYDHVSLYEASVEDVCNSVSFNPDVIIMDPPREGLGKKTLIGILSQGAPRLVYISCDPATMARDARQLVDGGYELTKIALLDMFPQTYHVETVVMMSRVKE